MPELQVRTRVVILMHVRERNMPTRTAPWVVRAVPGSEIRMRGERDHRTEVADLLDGTTQPLLLFPSEDARVLEAGWVSELSKPVTLLVPDGSWRQTKKVSRREPELAGVPRVKLPAGPESEYRLRREPHSGFVCTYEAVARALGVLESPEVQLKLEIWFRELVERSFRMR